jgi:putative ABC transport system permease protein
MFRLAFTNLIAHKIRTIALLLTVVLGVSFVVGTYVLTDTITKVFDDIFAEAYSGIDVNVRHASALGIDTERQPVPESLLDVVKAVPGVRAAEGSVFAVGVQIVDAHGDRVGNPYAPAFGTTWGDDDALSPFVLRSGHKPASANEVAIDAAAFKSGGFHLGDQITLVTTAGPTTFDLVGVAGFGRASNLAGATIAILPMDTAQTLLGRVGQFDSINIAAEPGISDEQLQERVAAALPSTYEAVTSTDLAGEANKSAATALGFFRTFMLIFAFVALFVGAFIVYNTYSIVIAERTRELALTRALGASSALVLVSVVLEAVITGALASLVGIASGVGIAVGLRRLLDALGFTMPSGDLVLLGRTIWIAMIGGPLITALASIVPAWRASRVAPVAAMQSTATERRNPVPRNVIGALLAVGGIVSVLFGLDGAGLPIVGAGAVATFVGVAMVAPLICRPAVAVLGSPVEHLGAAGLLADQNAKRSPRRTATTASALMIGTALMAASFIMSRSITDSVDRAVNGSAVADLVIRDEGQTGFSSALADGVEHLDGVQSVARYRYGRFKLGNATKNLVAMPAAALDPTSPEQAIDIDIRSGDVTQLANGGIAVQRQVARDHGWQLGDTIVVTTPAGNASLPLVATYEKNTLVGDYVVDLSTFDANYVHTSDFLVLVRLTDPDRQLAAVQTKIQSLVDTGYPGLKVEDRAQYVASTKARVAQFTNLITALLALAVAIALLGVLITMLLSVSERTRELGLLRAVGMSRRQTRSMVRWEAAIVSLFGAVLGLFLGAFFGLALVDALHSQGVTETVIPVRPLVTLALVIALLGVVASVYPARRAARLNVIAAVASL